MSSMTLKDMIEFLEHKIQHTGFADPQDRQRLEAVKDRLHEMFRLRGLILNCPDADEEAAQKFMKCLDLKAGS